MATRLAFAALHPIKLVASPISTASLTLPAGHNLIGTPFVVVVLLVAATLTFVLNPRDTLVRIFALLLLTAALIVGINPLFEQHNPWGQVIDGAANGLGPALFLRFCLIFPHRQPRDIAHEKRWLRTVYAHGPCVPLVAALIYVVTLPATGWLSRLGVISISLGILFGLAGGLVTLGRTFLRNRAPSVRGPILVVWLGAALTFVPLMGLNVVPMLFFQPSLIPFADSSYVLLFLPLSVGFATMRWGPFSLAAFIDRVSVYTALGALLLGCYAGLALLLTMWEGVPFSLVPATISLALAVIAAGTFAPARAALERAVDSLVYRDHYDLGATLQRFSRSLATIRDRSSVTTTLLDDLCETLNLSGAAFVALPGGLTPEVLQLIEPDDLEARRDFADAATRAVLASQLVHMDIADARWPDQPPIVSSPWPGCAALVLIRGGNDVDVSALLIVGSKRGGGPLRGKDRVVLATVAHQASTALENAALLGGLETTMSQLRRSAEELEGAQAEQHLLLREVVDADERQRASLARDLHDDAIQDLVYVSRHSRYCLGLLQSERVGGSNSDHRVNQQMVRLREELERLFQAASDAERKLRDLCGGLYPALLESLGLVPALEALADDLGAAEGVTITVECDQGVNGLVAALGGDTRLHLYRIAQEAARNAARHANAHHVAIRLGQAIPVCGRTSSPRLGSPIQLTLSISDDGKGMDLPVDYATLLRNGHLGLASMRERAGRIGAELMLNHCAACGLCIWVTGVVPPSDTDRPHVDGREEGVSRREEGPHSRAAGRRSYDAARGHSAYSGRRTRH